MVLASITSSRARWQRDEDEQRPLLPSSSTESRDSVKKNGSIGNATAETNSPCEGGGFGSHRVGISFGRQDEELQLDHDGCFPPHGVNEMCPVNPCRDLPTYRTIHTIRRDVVKAIEDPYSLEQLRDPRMNVSVVRPLVDKCYENQDISMVYCLLVNRTQFLREQVSQGHHQNVCNTRALLCEIVANRVLRRFMEDNPGLQGLLLLTQILIGGFDPFQGAPADVVEENSAISWTLQTRNGKQQKLPALELAIISESKLFLSSAACQKVVSAIYEGRVIYTPTSFIDLLPDHYKQKPLTLYNPRKAPILNQYRMIVPRTRNVLEVIHFMTLLVLYLLVMNDKNAGEFEKKELMFIIYTLGWVLDQIAAILEHGWGVYTMNLWSFLDVTFSCIFFIYLGLRVHSHRTKNLHLGVQALDVLSMAAPVLIPRLAFNLMSENMLFVSLRAMMRDFFVLSILAVWCFVGFLLSMFWLANGAHTPVTISKWLMWIWFGLDGTGIQRSVEIHRVLGPLLMVAFAFLGNTLFLTILVSMLSTTFAGIVSNATAEIQFRRAILTFEGVKSDAIFAYQPPFNLLALVLLLPLKFVLTPRWFHKTNVTAQRILNAPLLIIISWLERRALWSGNRRQKEVEPLNKTPNRAGLWNLSRGWSVHGDINRIFDSLPPDEQENEDDDRDAVVDDIDDELVVDHFSPHEQSPKDSAFQNEFDKAFGKVSGNQSGDDGIQSPKLSRMGTTKSRRDSVLPWVGNESSVMGDIGVIGEEMEKRLENLEAGMRRIENLLERLLTADSGGDSDSKE